MIAHLVIAAPTWHAVPTAADKWRGYTLPALPPSYLAPHRNDATRELVPWNVRHDVDVGVVPLPAVPVAATKTCRFDGDHDAVRWWRWIGELLDGERALELVEGDGAQVDLTDWNGWRLCRPDRVDSITSDERAVYSIGWSPLDKEAA